MIRYLRRLFRKPKPRYSITISWMGGEHWQRQQTAVCEIQGAILVHAVAVHIDKVAEKMNVPAEKVIEYIAAMQPVVVPEFEDQIRPEDCED